MIGTIRRHQNWLWMVIIAATIVSFLIYFQPNAKNGNGGDSNNSGGNFGSINGDAITRDQFLAAEQEGRIFFRLNYGTWPDTEDAKKNLRQYTAQRLVLNAALDEYHISVTPEAAARFIRQILGIKPEDSVAPDKILEALGKLAKEGNVSLDDFDRFARHQAGQEYLIALVGMSGKLITPKEAEIHYRRENEPLVTELVTFPVTNYSAKSGPSEKEIEDFYTKRQADYRVSDRITVNYVEFNASNYIGAVEKQLGTNLDPHVEQEYLQAGPTAFKDEAGTQLSPAVAKAKIKKQTIMYYALIAARTNANAFLNDLTQAHDEQHPYTTADLATLAKTKNLTVRASEPFDLKTPPKELAVAPKALRVLFSLRADDPDDKERSMLYAPSPLVGDDAVYVVGLRERIPSRIQPLAEVRPQVVADYRRTTALEQAKAAGARFEEQLNAGLAQGKTFDTMCAAQFVRPVNLTPFSLTTASIPDVSEKLQFQELQDLAGRMQPGQCSPFMPTADGGFVLYVKGRMPADEAAMKRDLPLYLERLRAQLQAAAFSAWFGKQYQTHYNPPPGENPATSAGG